MQIISFHDKRTTRYLFHIFMWASCPIFIHIFVSVAHDANVFGYVTEEGRLQDESPRINARFKEPTCVCREESYTVLLLSLQKNKKTLTKHMINSMYDIKQCIHPARMKNLHIFYDM